MTKRSAKASALQSRLVAWDSPDDVPAHDVFVLGLAAMAAALMSDTSSRTITDAARVAAAALIDKLPEDGAKPPEYERGRRVCRLYLYAAALEAERDRRETPELKKLVITTRRVIRSFNALCRSDGPIPLSISKRNARDEAMEECALMLANLAGQARSLRARRLSDLVWRVYGAAHAYAVELNREAERRDPPPRCFDGSPALSSLRLYLAQVAVGDAAELSELRRIMRDIRDADGMN